jgi:hypothetical protein
MSSSSLLQRMKKLVEEQDHLLEVELRKEREYEVENVDILECSDYKRLTAMNLKSSRQGRDQGKLGKREESREQESGRGSADEDTRE